MQNNLPEPHRLDGGDMPISWYKEVLEYRAEQNRINRKEIQRLKKVLIKLQELLIKELN